MRQVTILSLLSLPEPSVLLDQHIPLSSTGPPTPAPCLVTGRHTNLELTEVVQDYVNIPWGLLPQPESCLALERTLEKAQKGTQAT